MQIDFDQPHRRFDQLSGEWVLVSPHRAKRPWLGQLEKIPRSEKIDHDKNCFLCAGNVRVNGDVNPNYSETFVFKNDFSALLEDTHNGQFDDGLFKISSASGESRVICFSPNHSKTIADMEINEIKSVVNCWRDQSVELGKIYNYVQIFENKGEIMGCSNPHPHCQIWASDFVPTNVSREIQNLNNWQSKNKANMLLHLVEREIKNRERLIYANQDWAIIIPFWAKWPFEALLLPRFSIQRLGELNQANIATLADAMKVLTQKYDGLFDCSFPYSMGWHCAPNDGQSHESFQLHAHYFPPLLRSASVKKFMVGFELLAEAQRDLTPEQAAMKLKEVEI